MPQVAPLNWLTLFIYFSILLMLINPLNFFLNQKSIKKFKTSSGIKTNRLKMMSNLFSAFDPSTQFLSLNWLSSLTFILLVPQMYWFIPSRMIVLWNTVITKLHFAFKTLIEKSNGSTLIFISLFSFILMNNFLGLFPYIFTSSNNFLGLFPYIFTGSSHLTFTLTLALPLWLSFMILI